MESRHAAAASGRIIEVHSRGIDSMTNSSGPPHGGLGLLADPLLPALRHKVRAAMTAAVVEDCVSDAPAGRAPLERWNQYPILAYIDLKLASHALNLSLSDSKIGQLMFPDPNRLGGKQDDPRRLRRTVRELAMDVMTYAGLVDLGYEVQYYMRRPAGGTVTADTLRSVAPGRSRPDQDWT